ncbi:hypothetical protein [Dokdonella immobilis]|uniref:Uncharacterized protein n=1 Tax=Dokdonella immobilis TaxID=578942 RepID=A0A1I4Z3F4_9GAMM|nr:hypothetical protein [Dokdonella immobilis]SFN44593.1 hypothetical protein SAMN05216289_12213 [Dokdonella immobilis]
MLRSQRLASRIQRDARILAGALIACHADIGRADTYSVGAGTGCTHASVSAAIVAAEGHPGDDTIRLTRSLGYSQQALVVSTAQNLEITGGFASCTQASGDGIATTLDGAGGASEPVLRLTANGNARLTLRHLTIRGGDEDGEGEGGGILFRGSGALDIADSTLTANLAGYGGGLYAEGTGPDASLVLGANVLVTSNIARYSGGGVYIENIAMVMTDAESTLAFNRALGSDGQGGFGGGLMILCGSRPAWASIGSGGPGGIGAIYSNEAVYGGGVAIVVADGSDEDAALFMASAESQFPTSIRGNFASSAGGGIYARPDRDTFANGVSGATAYLWNASIVDNAAPDGAAVYLDQQDAFLASPTAGGFWFNVDTPPGTAVPCSPDAPCGAIVGNDASDGTQLTGGATIRLRSGAHLHLNGYWNDAYGPSTRGIVLRGNRGGRLIYANADAIVDLSNLLVVDNVASAELLRFAGESFARTAIDGTTIANNAIGAGHVIAKSMPTTLRNSIVWQPGKTTLQDNGGPLDVETVVASEVASLHAGPEAVVAEPRFIDPARGDLGLRAASPAVDAAVDRDANDADALARPREVDLPIVENSRGSRDIGALERQLLDPLVLNGDLDADANLWTQSVPGLGNWDGSQNAAGTTGSGSLKLEQAGTPNLQRVYGMSQCIHLPGPGIYALNGWGRAGSGGVGNRDYVYLHWELRRFGGEACNQGPADATGDHFLSNSSNWQHPANPSLIAIPAADWTYTSSIVVTHVVNEFGTTSPSNTIGWADGITLTVSEDDMLFRTGFDP